MKKEKLLNIRLILSTLGSLLFFEVVFMALAGIVALSYNGGDAFWFGVSTLITLAVASLCYFPFKDKNQTQLKKRDGYFVVTFVWIVFSLFGSLPFYLSGCIPNYTNAFFETISGFTTTGATILADVEALPHGILFWRSIIQWLGGMGIIVLSLAVLPIFGIGGMQLYVAEVPGPTKDKIRPRVAQTAKLLWSIYTSFTLIQVILLCIAGMDLFDSVCHSFTTISTGGFSTKNDSLAYWNSAFIDYIVIFFMLISGLNYTLIYTGIRGNLEKFIRNEEFKYYIITGFTFALIITICHLLQRQGDSESIIRGALFQSFSVMVGTGFSTTDYTLWSPFLLILFMLMMMVGGCAGSATGGIKMVRLILLVKNSYYEFKRLLHPNAVLPVKFNKKVVQMSIVNNVLAFVVLYALISFIGILTLLTLGIEPRAAVGASISCMGNVGLAFGALDNSGSFAAYPDCAKWIMTLLMLIGRLEIFTVLFLFSPSFWKK